MVEFSEFHAKSALYQQFVDIVIVALNFMNAVHCMKSFFVLIIELVIFRLIVKSIIRHNSNKWQIYLIFGDVMYIFYVYIFVYNTVLVFFSLIYLFINMFYTGPQCELVIWY